MCRPRMRSNPRSSSWSPRSALKVIVSLAGLDLIDQSGVAVIVGLYKRVRTTGGQVNVVGARDQPLAIFKLLRMDRVFGL